MQIRRLFLKCLLQNCIFCHSHVTNICIVVYIYTYVCVCVYTYICILTFVIFTKNYCLDRFFMVPLSVYLGMIRVFFVLTIKKYLNASDFSRPVQPCNCFEQALKDWVWGVVTDGKICLLMHFFFSVLKSLYYRTPLLKSHL